MIVLITQHRFTYLAPERSVLAPLGTELLEAESAGYVYRQARKADVLLVTPVMAIDAALIERLVRCRAIVRYGVGVDNVDLEAATRAGIPVGYVSVGEVADHAVTLALSLLRRVPESTDDLRQGSWSTTTMRGVQRLSELTVGIIGLGRIGQAVATRFEAFGLRIVAHDPYMEAAEYPLHDLRDLLEQADVVTLHLPLNTRTRGLLSREQLGLLRRSAIVVNTSRGELVDDLALADMLHRGDLQGAALDVFRYEPLPADHPLRGAPHTILTPHVSWYSEQAIRELQAKAAEQAARALSCRRVDPVANPDVYLRPIRGDP